MKKLYELKQAEANYKAVIATQDITIKKKSEVKTLVDEAKEKTKQEILGNGFMIHVVRSKIK